MTALSFTPTSWLAITVGTLLIALTYACVGVIAGSVLGQLGAIYLVLLIAMLSQGLLQDPMFGSGTPSRLAVFFPDYAATRVDIVGGFSASFHVWGQLGLAIGWLVVLAAAAALVLRHLLFPRSARSPR